MADNSWAEEAALFSGKSLSDAELADHRGTASFNPVGIAQLDAIATGNSVTNSRTGTNAVMEGAFNGAQGVINFIQNSGNNVVIQSSTIVNLSLE